jgi:hypothetical protein
MRKRAEARARSGNRFEVFVPVSPPLSTMVQIVQADQFDPPARDELN